VNFFVSLPDVSLTFILIMFIKSYNDVFSLEHQVAKK